MDKNLGLPKSKVHILFSELNLPAGTLTAYLENLQESISSYISDKSSVKKEKRKTLFFNSCFYICQKIKNKVTTGNAQRQQSWPSTDHKPLHSLTTSKGTPIPDFFHEHPKH